MKINEYPLTKIEEYEYRAALRLIELFDNIFLKVKLEFPGVEIKSDLYDVVNIGIGEFHHIKLASGRNSVEKNWADPRGYEEWAQQKIIDHYKSFLQGIK